MGRYSSDAASSSNSPKTIPRISISSFFYLSAFAVLFAWLGYTLNSSINSAYHEAIRHAWSVEERYHWKQRNTWALEATKHQEIRQAWSIEEQDHWKQRNMWSLEVAKHEDVRQAWNIEELNHSKERDEWALEVAKHQELRAQMNHEEATWEDRRASREERERQRHDDEVTKKREGLSWEGLAPARCLRYATREYTAVLAHVPLGFDALAECRNKTVNIHGRDLLPSRCEDQVGSYTQGSPGSTNYTAFVGSMWASYWTLGCGL